MPEMTTMGRLAVSAGLGVIATVLVGVFGRWADAFTIGWDTTALVYVATTWAVCWPMDSVQTAAKARSEDPNRAVSDVLTLSAAVASLASVGVILLIAHSADRATADGLAALALASIAISWFTVHTIFALRYALVYYGPPARVDPGSRSLHPPSAAQASIAGGIDFNQTEPPTYKDFCYLAITIGMTFQVSDTALGSTVLRATAMRHALLSYLFGTIILAAAINLIAGLGSSGLIH